MATMLPTWIMGLIAGFVRLAGFAAVVAFLDVLFR